MALPASAYPAAVPPDNEQSVAADIPGDTTKANGLDYNKNRADIKAIATDLVAASADASDADIATAIARLNVAAASAPDGFTSHLWVPAPAFIPYSGTWVWTLSSGQYYQRSRNAFANESKIIAPLGVRGRSTSRGLRIDSFDFVYRITGGAVSTDLTFFLRRWDIPADTAGPSGGVALGTYDTAHDSALKRGAVAQHTANVTVNEFVADYAWNFEAIINDTGGGSAVFKIYGARVNLTDVPA